MQTKPKVVLVEDHPLLACSQMIENEDLDGLSESLRRAEADQDQELVALLQTRQRSAHDGLYDKAIGILNEFKQSGKPLLPLDRPVIVRLAAQAKVTPEEISADLEDQVLEVVSEEPKTSQEIGEAIDRGGQSVKAILSRLLTSGRLTKRGGLYSHVEEAPLESVEA